LAAGAAGEQPEAEAKSGPAESVSRVEGESPELTATQIKAEYAAAGDTPADDVDLEAEENNVVEIEDSSEDEEENGGLSSGSAAVKPTLNSSGSSGNNNNNIKPKLADRQNYLTPVSHPGQKTVVPVHGGVFTSDEWFETEDAIILKVDYTKSRYFPEKGPYRCEICLEILETNKEFFQHVRQNHLQEANIVALDIMKHHLAVQTRSVGFPLSRRKRF